MPLSKPLMCIGPRGARTAGAACCGATVFISARPTVGDLVGFIILFQFGVTAAPAAAALARACRCALRRWYGWSEQHAALYRLICGHSLRSTSHCTGMERHTVRRWRDWLACRGDLFSLHLRSRFPELARSAGQSGFWKNALESMSLGRAMAWLDLELTVP